MASTTCPKCKISVRRGSWEYFTHCPECGVEWVVDPDLPARVQKKIMTSAVVYAALSVVPALGVLFGLAGAFWGYLAVKRDRVILGVSAMSFAILVGVVAQPVLIWWGIGFFSDAACKTRLTTLRDSIYAYHTLTGKYPPTLKAMADARLRAPTVCPSGGGEYYYLCPGTRAPASMPATAASQPSSAPTTVASWGPEATSLPATATSSTGPTTLPDSIPDISGDPRGLMVAEVLSAHRKVHMCIMGDLTVQALAHKEFEKLRAEPQNREFAKGFNKVWTAATQPAPKKPPASQSATAASQSATTSSGPSTASSQDTTALSQSATATSQPG